MKRGMARGACLPGFHPLGRNLFFFATMMLVCQVFINCTFSVFQFFFCIFQDVFQFLDFLQDVKYVHGSSETRLAVKPLQVESVDRLLEHFSFGC